MKKIKEPTPLLLQTKPLSIVSVDPKTLKQEFEALYKGDERITGHDQYNLAFEIFCTSRTGVKTIVSTKKPKYTGVRNASS